MMAKLWRCYRVSYFKLPDKVHSKLGEFMYFSKTEIKFCNSNNYFNW